MPFVSFVVESLPVGLTGRHLRHDPRQVARHAKECSNNDLFAYSAVLRETIIDGRVCSDRMDDAAAGFGHDKI
jgi:hypothetical protein